MKPMVRHLLLVATLLGGLALVPLGVKADTDTWLDQIIDETQYHQRMAKFEGKAESYEPYLAQLEQARVAFKGGDRKGTYAAMNQFMEALLAPEEGLPAWSAKALFDYCVVVTPVNYHDAQRHNPLKSKGDFDYTQGRPLWVGDGDYFSDETFQSVPIR